MAPIANLTVRLSAQIAEFQSEFREATKSAQKFADDFQGTATKASAIGSFFGNIAADIARSIASGLGSAARDAVKFSSEFNNAFIGLGSVARAFGTDTNDATAAARRLSSDGLLPLKDSASGLKNLLASGFNLEQSTKLMNAFKDSAAFGRQGALSFGDAIRSATEGVKNGNSILVDNAGVTKNLSQILKEAGYSAQDLSRASSDAGVRMALFNGILKETRAQTGDAERLTQTYAGQVTRLGSAYDTFLASLGDAITQNKDVAIAIGAVGTAVQNLTKFLSENGRGFNLVSDAVILLAKSLSLSLQAVDLIQTGFAGLQITFNQTAKAALEMARDILIVGANAAHLRAVLDPVFGDEWRKKALLADAAVAVVSNRIAGFVDASKDAEARSIRWGNALQTGVANIDALAVKLEAARGQTVKFGDATTTSAESTDRSSEALRSASVVSREAVQALGLLEVARRHEAASVQFAESAWKSWEATVSRALANIPTNPVLLQGRNLSGIVPQIDTSGIQTAIIAAAPAAKTSFLGAMFGGDFGQRMGSAIMSAIQGGGNLFAAAAGTIGNALTSGIAKTITSGAGLAISGALGGAINAILPGLGSLLGPLVDRLFSAFDRNKGRDVVENFAAGFGGFDALHRQLLELGAQGEQLWIRLTQGVGRNNPDQARAAIEAITRAFEQQKAAVKETTAVTEESMIAQSQATQKALDAIKGMDDQIASLQQSIANEAPEEVIGIIEANTRAQIDAIVKERTAAQAALDDIAIQSAEAGREAGDIIDQALSEREFHIKVKVDLDGLPGGVPALANGGIVRRRTLALVGESGPEAVVPLSQMGRGFGGTPNLDVTLRLPNNQVLLRQFVKGMQAEGLA